MLFASFPYLFVFLPVVVVAAVVLRKLAGPKVAQGWVLLASIVFYAKSNPFNLIYLAASILANWGFAKWMERTEGIAKKRILVCALVLNVSYLCMFKYLGFFASMAAFALPSGYVAPNFGFPLGISFFTITSIMYLVDCYEDSFAAGTLFNHATFITFFPYLISGPLGRAKRMQHQFGNFGGLDATRGTMLARGFYLFALGLFKKAVFANSFAQFVKYGSTTATNLSALEAWAFSLGYALQIYFDFSGYSDMAIGSAMMLGIEIPRNFDAPYGSKSIIEYWQRWHISLTGFITTYLYTPILRKFKKRTLFTSGIATLIAMGIAGLWHGAAWTFVVFGAMHGLFLAVNQYWRKSAMPRIPALPSHLLTIACFVIALVYFGADSMHAANARVLTMFNPHHMLAVANLTSIRLTINGYGMRVSGWLLLLGLGIAFFGPSSEQRARDFNPTALNCAYSVGLTAISCLMLNSIIPAPFIYFRF